MSAGTVEAISHKEVKGGASYGVKLAGVEKWRSAHSKYNKAAYDSLRSINKGDEVEYEDEQKGDFYNLVSIRRKGGAAGAPLPQSGGNATAHQPPAGREGSDKYMMAAKYGCDLIVAGKLKPPVETMDAIVDAVDTFAYKLLERRSRYAPSGAQPKPEPKAEDKKPEPAKAPTGDLANQTDEALKASGIPGISEYGLASPAVLAAKKLYASEVGWLEAMKLGAVQYAADQVKIKLVDGAITFVVRG